MTALPSSGRAFHLLQTGNCLVDEKGPNARLQKFSIVLRGKTAQADSVTGGTRQIGHCPPPPSSFRPGANTEEMFRYSPPTDEQIGEPPGPTCK